MSSAFVPPPKISDLRAATLAAISDDDVEFSLVDYVATRIGANGNELDAIERLPPRLLTWYITFVVDAEVLNGGFNQLFFNPSGRYATMAPMAFEEIGAPEAAALVAQALSLLDQHAPALEAAAEEGTLEAFARTYLDQPFGELDSAYAAGEPQWRAARLRYVRDNSDTLGDA